MTTKITVTDEAVEAAQKAWTKAYWTEATPGKSDWMRAALEAAVPHLQVEPEQPWLMIHHIRAVRDAGYIVTTPGNRDAQVDAAARAIHRWDKRPITWSNLTPDERSQYISEAEAVIAALPSAVPQPVDRGAIWRALSSSQLSELIEVLEALGPNKDTRPLGVDGPDNLVHAAYVNAQRAVSEIEWNTGPLAASYPDGRYSMQVDAVRVIRTAAEEAGR